MSYHSLLIIGENPEELAEGFSTSAKVEKVLKYRRSDASKMRESHIRQIEEILSSRIIKLTDEQRTYFEKRLDDIKEGNDFQYYLYITKGCYYDEETGDAYSLENPNGKYSVCTFSDDLKYSEEFVLMDGSTSFSSRARDIDWGSMHYRDSKVHTCETVWELVKGNAEPSNEEEENLKSNWENRTEYLSNFSDKEEFIRHICSFWHYAVIKDGEYIDVDESGLSDKEWVGGFYDRFIEGLEDDTLLTVVEIVKN